MEVLPFDVRFELEGWTLFCARLTVLDSDETALAALREATEQRVKQDYTREALAGHPTVAALRGLFRAAGCDPTRYRPSSEALLRRILKGDPIPSIYPLVDLNNCLSARLAVPCCVMDERRVATPWVLRAGVEGEAYESLRGPFNLAGKPLLCDPQGPLDSPITGSQKVKMTSETAAAWLVAYLPSTAVEADTARQVLEELVTAAPVAHIDLVASVAGAA